MSSNSSSTVNLSQIDIDTIVAAFKVFDIEKSGQINRKTCSKLCSTLGFNSSPRWNNITLNDLLVFIDNLSASKHSDLDLSLNTFGNFVGHYDVIDIGLAHDENSSSIKSSKLINSKDIQAFLAAMDDNTSISSHELQVLLSRMTEFDNIEDDPAFSLSNFLKEMRNLSSKYIHNNDK